MLALLCSTAFSCDHEGPVQEEGPTFLELVEVQRAVCHAANECGAQTATPDQLEACALAASTRYAKAGPACASVVHTYWECALAVEDEKQCAGWSAEDPGTQECMAAADYSVCPHGFRP